MIKHRRSACLSGSLMLSLLALPVRDALGQELSTVSVGRGAPVNVQYDYPRRGSRPPPSPQLGVAEIYRGYLLEYPVVGPLRIVVKGENGSPDKVVDLGWAFDGAVPEGIEPLPVDIFSTKDFYQDKQYWSDQRYWRCNSSFGIEQQRGASPITEATITDDPAKQAAWGYCDRDYPREEIVSPYKFRTAQAHYEALLEEARAHGGPTKYTYATLPHDWTGRYASANQQMAFANWYGTFLSQVPTLLSLLTDEYQTRFVQQLYHEGTTNAPQWPGMYCWPEGFMRRFHWAGTGARYFLLTPEVVQIWTSSSGNFLTNIYVDREFDMSGKRPRLGEEVPQWYGDTVGFWDGEVLITWTSNIQGWLSHGQYEFSNELQTIEIYTPNRTSDGTLAGLVHEAVFYDPEALVEPVRIVRNYEKANSLRTGPPARYVECNPQIFPINGRAQSVAPGTVIENFEVLDMYDRPWAQIWREYWEKDMHPPEVKDIFDFE